MDEKWAEIKTVDLVCALIGHLTRSDKNTVRGQRAVAHLSVFRTSLINLSIQNLNIHWRSSCG